MFFNRYAVATSFILLTVLPPNSQASVKSYREWKTERIQWAQNKVTSIKSQIDAKKSATRTTATGIDPNLENKLNVEAGTSNTLAIDKLEKQLSTEMYDLELANELSVTDYFVGYLIKAQDKKTAFNEVAGKLSPEEVAELMSAYATAVFGPQAISDQVTGSSAPKAQKK